MGSTELMKRAVHVTTANLAVIDIWKDINAPFTLTEINQIVYATASIITESPQNQRKSKKKKIHQHGKQNSRKKSQESQVIYPFWQK